ncbi:unnamed protein product [Owenia fusiformis]|uniref:EGF-like domain-containing protein n=1 Tax=Owenia fusiformis TaxID=6347 RepID=A0A8S4NKM8_OWEFU|nr:unnamed protein product [Owenia fusiformis]
MTIDGHHTFAEEYQYQADPELVNRILDIKEVNDMIDSIGNYLNSESMLSASAKAIQKSYKAVRSKIKKQKEFNAALSQKIESIEYPIQHAEEILYALYKQDIALNKFGKSIRSFKKITDSISKKTNSMKTALNAANDTVTDTKDIINVYLNVTKESPVPGNPCILNQKVCGKHGLCSFGEAFQCLCAGFYNGTYCEDKTDERCTLKCPFDIGDRKSRCVIYNGFQTCECPTVIYADLGCIAVPGSNDYYGYCRLNCEDEEEEE